MTRDQQVAQISGTNGIVSTHNIVVDLDVDRVRLGGLLPYVWIPIANRRKNLLLLGAFDQVVEPFQMVCIVRVYHEMNLVKITTIDHQILPKITVQDVDKYGTAILIHPKLAE